MKRSWIVLVASLVVLTVAGCGDGDDETTAADEERYCELSAELDEIGGRIFLELDDDATVEEIAAAERELVEEADEELDELTEVAPAAIADEVEAYVAAFRARAAGDDVDVSDEAIVAWEEEHCQR